MAKICIFLIELYRKYISRYTRPTCRFSPTCSTYAMESYKSLIEKNKEVAEISCLFIGRNCYIWIKILEC